MGERRLALKTEDRLRHTFVLGPTGSGKSWLLGSLILQDIRANRGVVVIDVKGDLVTDVLARIDEHDAERVIVLDASKRDRPIGFNILGQAHSEEARELIVDNVVHIFREIWSAYWGPRSDHILRGTLNTLVGTQAPDGSAFTLHEIVPLLTQPAFRRAVLHEDHMSKSLHAFWQWYDRLSDSERAQVIGPVLNKVEAFTSRTPIRLLLGQSEGIDLGTVFSERKALLVSLAKGTLGTETANLLGSLLVSALWQATLARVRVAPARRHPVFAYIDEAQDIVRLPLAIADMLAQARGLGLGLILANQYLAQLPESVKAAMLGTVRTQATFAVEHEDAGVLARRFAPLTVDDLKGLGHYEIAVRPCVDGTTLAPVTGTTLALNAPVRDAAELARTSRERYGVPRAEVEAAIEARTGTTNNPSASFGRRTRGGRS
jgi:type IV secretory pathway TraG/TraD family ATPase VirD4